MKFISFTILLAVTLAACSSKSYRYTEGCIYGTFYHITYESPRDLDTELRTAMNSVNQSLSMFDSTSTISRINHNQSMETDSLFRKLFALAKGINRTTDGAFDITVAPLVNAWGFGYKSGEMPSPVQIDSILQFVGMDKVELSDLRIRKAHPHLEMDASAIAKGLGVDVAADCLEACGVANYVVEIGGEVRVKGLNRRQQAWRIGIDQPVDDTVAEKRTLQSTLHMTQGALASSGNYRNFYVKDGKKYAHTINPKSGYPIQNDILSASVYADKCMTADAFATAFMVLGLEKSQAVLAQNPDIAAYFIYDENGTFKTWMSPNFSQLNPE